MLRCQLLAARGREQSERLGEHVFFGRCGRLLVGLVAAGAVSGLFAVPVPAGTVTASPLAAPLSANAVVVSGPVVVQGTAGPVSAGGPVDVNTGPGSVRAQGKLPVPAGVGLGLPRTGSPSAAKSVVTGSRAVGRDGDGGVIVDNGDGTKSLLARVVPDGEVDASTKNSKSGKAAVKVAAKGNGTFGRSGRDGSEVTFGGSSDGDSGVLVKISKNGKSVGFDLDRSPGANGKPGRRVRAGEQKGKAGVKAVAEASRVKYPGVLGDADLLLASTEIGVKEAIVLGKQPKEAPVYRFPLQVSGLVPEVRDGEIVFREPNDADVRDPKGPMTPSVPKVRGGGDVSDGDVVFRIPAGVAWDSTGGVSTPGNRLGGVKMELDGDSVSGWDLVVTVDPVWLMAKDRVFPVLIDPTITTPRGSQNSLRNLALGWNQPTGDTGWAMFGNWYGGTWKSLMKFDTASVPTNAVVTSAVLHLFVRNCDISGTAAVYANPINVRRVTGGWTPTAPGQWVPPLDFNAPQVAATSLLAVPGYTTFVDLAVTDWAKGWVAQPTGNYGVQLDMGAVTNSYCVVLAGASQASFTYPVDPTQLSTYLELTYETPGTTEDSALVPAGNYENGAGSNSACYYTCTQSIQSGVGYGGTTGWKIDAPTGGWNGGIQWASYPIAAGKTATMGAWVKLPAGRNFARTHL